MKNYPLAVLEGPRSQKLRGFRHVMLVTKGYPKICLSSDGGRRAAMAFGVPHYAAGTWEALAHQTIGFPLPRPDILTEILGTKQQELLA